MIGWNKNLQTLGPPWQRLDIPDLAYSFLGLTWLTDTLRCTIAPGSRVHFAKQDYRVKLRTAVSFPSGPRSGFGTVLDSTRRGYPAKSVILLRETPPSRNDTRKPSGAQREQKVYERIKTDRFRDLD